MVYYTSAFKEFVSDPWKKTTNLWCDPARFIKRQIAFANVVLQENKIPVKLELHCLEELEGFDESSNPQERLYKFRDAKGSLDSLLNSADIAVLMTGTSCPAPGGRFEGRAFVGPPGETEAPPVCWVHPRREISFLHEIAHIFGCRHNREIDTKGDNHQDYYFGNLVKGTNMATIMAYTSDTHYQKVSYFSSEDLEFEGVKMGNAKNDN